MRGLSSAADRDIEIGWKTILKNQDEKYREPKISPQRRHVVP